jgi:hypothetical protein
MPNLKRYLVEIFAPMEPLPHRSGPSPRITKRYSGYCRYQQQSGIFATAVQIFLRRKCFTDSMTRLSGENVKLFNGLYDDMREAKRSLDIGPLIKLCSGFLTPQLELPDCLSGLFHLFQPPIPRMASNPDVIHRIPHGTSLSQCFSRLGVDRTAALDVMFFDARSVVLSHIPDSLGEFSLYVVVNSALKASPRLYFRDSEGWLSISRGTIEEVSSFRRTNVCLLGYIRDLHSTNVFRSPVATGPASGKHSHRSSIVISTSQPISMVRRPLFPPAGSCDDLESGILLPTDPRVRVSVVFWPDDSPWGAEERITVVIESNATAAQLLTISSDGFESKLSTLARIRQWITKLSKFFGILTVSDWRDWR